MHRWPYFRKAVSNEAMPLMQRIKQALDPLGLVNPGKVLLESIVSAGATEDLLQQPGGR